MITFFFAIILLTNTITISAFATPSPDTNPNQCLIISERLKADAGPDQTVRSGDRVTLNGSGSTGLIFRYGWIAPYNLGQGSDLPLPSNDKAITFTAPQVPNRTVYTFQLVVYDNEIYCSSDYVDITVEPAVIFDDRPSKALRVITM